MRQTLNISAPTSENELLERTTRLAGKTIAQVAQQLGVRVPENQNHHKGWVGNLAETCLGATAKNQSEPDFQFIGVELKTVPMTRPGIPKESTYICTLNLTETTGISWEKSTVYKKLNHILWLPVESDPAIALKERRFGSAILWRPNPEQQFQLKNDWEEIMELVSLGELDKLSSSIGTYLQVRPKAANAKSLGRSYTEDGRPGTTLPRGFYLRTSFTRSIFN